MFYLLDEKLQIILLKSNCIKKKEMHTFKALEHIHHLNQKLNLEFFRSMKQQKASTVFRTLGAKYFSVSFCKSHK